MERKRKMSIMVRLLLMVISPCLLLGIAMTLYSGWNMQRGMQKTTLDGMRATDYAVLEMFKNIADGDFKQDAKGNVYRGEYKISDNNELADYIKNKTDVDVTFFYGDTRCLLYTSGSDQNEKVIYLGTFSKSIAPAVRVSYLVLPKKLVKVYTEKCGFYASTVPKIQQMTICNFMKEGYFERHLNRMRSSYKKKHDFLMDEIKKRKWIRKVYGDNAGLHVIAEIELSLIHIFFEEYCPVRVILIKIQYPWNTDRATHSLCFRKRFIVKNTMIFIVKKIRDIFLVLFFSKTFLTAVTGNIGTVAAETVDS